jgi:DNA-binding protein H-NS
MTFNLDKMSEAELKDLRHQVDRALATVNSRRRAEARKAAEEAVAKHGFSLSDFLGGKAEKTKSKSRGEARYRNPADPSQTWSGRGRQPEWMKAALAKGKSKSEFEI